MWSPIGEAVAWIDVVSADACNVACATASHTVESAFAGRVPCLVLRALVESVRRADEKLDSELLASLCGRSRRTLSRRLREVGLPSPEGVVAWGKIFASSWFLTHGSRSVEAVALELGLDGSGALVHLYRHYLDLTPGDVRRRGGLAVAITLLLDRTSACAHNRKAVGERL